MSDQILKFLEIMDGKQDARMASIEGKIDGIVTDCSQCRPQVVSLVRTRQSIRWGIGVIFTAMTGWLIKEKL